MTLDALAATLTTQGIVLRREGGSLRAKAPDGAAVPENVVAGLREAKTALLCQLSADDAVAAVAAFRLPAVPTLAQQAERERMRLAEVQAQSAYDARDVPAFDAAMADWIRAAARRCKEAA